MYSKTVDCRLTLTASEGILEDLLKTKELETVT